MHLKGSLVGVMLFERAAQAARVTLFAAMAFGAGEAFAQVSLPTSGMASTVASTEGAVAASVVSAAPSSNSSVASSVVASAATSERPPPMTTAEGLALARAKACLGCHQVDSKRVGPAFSAIAERRAEQEGAVAYLSHVIRKGGRGQWGAVPMPGQSVSEQDAQRLAQWIISLRKSP